MKLTFTINDLYLEHKVFQLRAYTNWLIQLDLQNS